MPKSIKQEVRNAAVSRVGKQFRHHYKPEDLCKTGTETQPSCMARGMDDEFGYDCSGLVIASLRDVLGLGDFWPSELRHVPQIVQQAQRESDDGITAFNFLGQSGVRRWHIGINNGDGLFIHANAISGKVDVSPVIGNDMRTLPISLYLLLKHL